MADGATYAEVARTSGVGRDTIKTRLDIARQKLGAKTTTHAVAIALREGLID